VLSREVVSWTNVRQGIAERLDGLRVTLHMALPFRRAVPSHAKRFVYLRELSLRAMRRYRPQPYAGRLCLLRCEIQPSAALYRPDPHLGWAGLAPNGIEVRQVPGSHGWHIREPHVQATARELMALLESVRA
jgi:thioesterase domain-containing protein